VESGGGSSAGVVVLVEGQVATAVAVGVAAAAVIVVDMAVVVVADVANAAGVDDVVDVAVDSVEVAAANDRREKRPRLPGPSWSPVVSPTRSSSRSMFCV
jgi:hypothetical protein